MSVETNLRAAMAEAVAPSHPDTDRLVADSRRRGLGIRRRRQALGSIGVVAALGLAVLAPNLVAGDRGDRSSDSMQVGTTAATFDLDKTAPITGRSNAAALMYAVGLEASGTATEFRGQGDGHATDGLVMTYAGFAFTPAGSDTAGEIGMNVQYVPPETQAKGGGASRMRCHGGYMEDCKITNLADGSVLRTSVQRSVYGDRTGLMRTADLVRPDHLRVVAFASNGSDISERDEKVTRSEPVLTIDQLTAVVTRPWWGPRLPTYFTEQGDKLPSFDLIGGATEATPSSSPLSSPSS
jgi:hypothetical protein